MSVASVGFNIPVSLVSPAHSPAQTARQPEAAENEPRQPATRSQSIQSTTEALEQVGRSFNRKLQFEVDQDSSQVIVKVIDRETDKVIREIPPEELQRMHSSLRDTIGFLFNEFA